MGQNSKKSLRKASYAPSLLEPANPTRIPFGRRTISSVASHTRTPFSSVSFEPRPQLFNVALINVQAPLQKRKKDKRILVDADITQNTLRASYTEGTLIAPTTEDKRHRPEHIPLIKFRNLTQWSDHLPIGAAESDDDNDSTGKDPASSPLSMKTTGTFAENPSSDWRDGIPQEAAEAAEADEKRAEDVMLEVMTSAVPKVH